MINLFYIFAFIFGLMMGSFLNCYIWRLREKESMWGRSHCPKCRHKISWYDNIPVLSYLILRAKCRYCGRGIAMQYLAVELITGILFVLVLKINFESMINNEFLIYLIRDWFIVCVMVIIFIYDLRWYLILDRITLPAIFIVFIINLFLGFSALNLLLAMAVGGGFFYLQFIVSGGRWIGGGGIRLGVLMGAILGWPQILVALFLAYIVGSVFSLGLVALKRKKLKSEIPFGTFLTVATVIALFWGDIILDWYLGVLR